MGPLTAVWWSSEERPTLAVWQRSAVARSSGAAAKESAYAAARRRTASSVAADTLTTYDPCGRGSRAAGAGASSTITCAFTPPIPNADTAARRGTPTTRGHDTG